MLREARKKLRNETPKKLTAHEYAIAIEVALKQEIGTSRHAVKTLSKLTNASEGTAELVGRRERAEWCASNLVSAKFFFRPIYDHVSFWTGKTVSRWIRNNC